MKSNDERIDSSYLDENSTLKVMISEFDRLVAKLFLTEENCLLHKILIIYQEFDRFFFKKTDEKW